MREEAFKDTRLLDALEYIDDSYISSAARYKMKYEEKSAPVLTWKTPLKHWKAFAALAACLLLLAFASPVVSYVVEAVRSFAAGWGSESTTEEVLETESLNSTETETVNDTDIYITTELHESVLTPDYLKFVPDLEPISEEMMLEIRKAWPEYRWSYWFDTFYTAYSNSAMQYSEAEARTLAEKSADEKIQDTEYIWFVLSVYNDKGDIPHYYRYYGMIDDYVVLVEYRRTTFNYSDEILYKKIGSHTFYFQAGGEIYLYKDGVFETMNAVYEQGLISDEDVGIMASRHTVYKQFYETWRKEEYYKYFAEKGEQ